MPGAAQDLSGRQVAGRRADIHLIYRTGGNLEIDQRNIALIARAIAKATSTISAEIFYHLPARLSDWTQPANGMRYTRVKSGEIWPLADRIAKHTDKTILAFDATLLISAEDVWHLIGYARQHDRVLLQPRCTARVPNESLLSFSLREARLQLERHVWGRVSDASAMSLLSPPTAQHGIRAQISYAELLQAGAEADLFTFYGSSRAVSARRSPRWLATAARTIAAFRHWRTHGAFAASYSQKTPVFHVAQLAVYLATLMALTAPTAGAIVLCFAIALTPVYFLGNLNIRRPMQCLRRLAARLALYYIG